MTKNIKRIEVDGEKLRVAFQKKNLKPAQVSKEMGKEQSYFGKFVCSKQACFTLGMTEVNFLEKVYGIKRSSYELRHEAEQTDIRNGEVYADVYLAVTQALNDFFNNKNEDG